MNFEPFLHSFSEDETVVASSSPRGRAPRGRLGLRRVEKISSTLELVPVSFPGKAKIEEGIFFDGTRFAPAQISPLGRSGDIVPYPPDNL